MPDDVVIRLSHNPGASCHQRIHVGSNDVPVDPVLGRLRLR
jgi:hypothetical protein